MARVRKRRRYGRDEIDAFLTEFNGSGMSQAAFARRRGLSLSTFQFWLARRRKQEINASRFLPVSVVDTTNEPVPPLELELGNGRRIHIPLDVDREALRAVLPIVIASC